MTNDLVNLNVVISRQARGQLKEIMKTFKLPNLNLGVEKAVEIACESLGTVKEKSEK